MNQKCETNTTRNRQGERGEGGLKLIIVLIILFLAGWAGWNYIPVAYQGQTYKQEMDTTVVQAMGLPTASGNPTEWARQRVAKLGADYGVPEDAVIEAKPLQGSNGGVEITVKFKRPVTLLPFYTYEYEFDYTAKPVGFLSK